MRNPILSSSAFGLLLCVLSAGCRDREIVSYRIPKEQDPVTPPAAQSAMAAPAAPVASAPTAPGPRAPNMADTAVPTANGADLVWTAPAHWVSKPPAAMRVATYAVSGDAGATADLSISAFPGTTGGEAANLNRWRNQLSLAPMSGADLASTITRFESNGLKFAVVDFTGQAAPAQRVIGAIVPVGSATWFFKLSGPEPLIAREQAAFNAFLKTIRVPAAKS